MTTKSTTRRSFTDAFKREAVLLLASSGRPLTQVAMELGVQPSMLRSWRGPVNGIAPQVAGAAGSPAVAASAEQSEIRRRLHSAIGYRSPNEWEQITAAA